MERNTGRNQASAAARNSRRGSARFATNVAPAGVSTSRCTRLCTGSATKSEVPSASGKAPPVYGVMAHADVNSPAPVSSSKFGRRLIGKTCAAAPWSGICAIAESSRRSGLRASHARRHHLVARMIGVLGGEVAAPRVEAVAELRRAARPLEQPRVRPQPHAAAVGRERRAMRMIRPAQRRAAVAEHVLVDDRRRRPFVRQVDPVVEPVQGPVHHVLRVGDREAGDDDRAHVGASVTVRVLEVQEVGRSRDEDALLPAHDARRERQAVGEDAAACRSGRRRPCPRAA